MRGANCCTNRAAAHADDTCRDCRSHESAPDSHKRAVGDVCAFDYTAADARAGRYC